MGGSARPAQRITLRPCEDFTRRRANAALACIVVRNRDEGKQTTLRHFGAIRPQRLLRSRRRLHRQVGGFPSGDATGNFADGFKSSALQQGRGDG
jgi:hypothetical protein